MTIYMCNRRGKETGLTQGEPAFKLNHNSQPPFNRTLSNASQQNVPLQILMTINLLIWHTSSREILYLFS